MLTSIRARLLALAGVPLVLVIVMITGEIWSKFQELHNMESLTGLDSKLGALIHETQVERGITSTFLNSQGDLFATELTAQRIRTQKQINALKAFLEDFDATGFGAEFQQSLQAAMEQMEQIDPYRQRVDTLTVSSEEVIDFYSQHNQRWIRLIQISVELTSHAGVGQLRAAYHHFIQGKEIAGVERAILSRVFANDSFARGEYEKSWKLMGSQDAFFNEFESLASPEITALYRSKMANPVVYEVQRMRETALAKGNHAAKSQLLSALYTGFGYGGAIHHFNNLLLRQSPKYKQAFDTAYQQVSKTLDQLAALPALSGTERAHLSTIRETIDRYQAASSQVLEMILAGRNITEIDRALAIDDGPAIAAIQALARWSSRSGFSIDPTIWFDSMTRKINLLQEVEEHIIAELNQRRLQLKAETDATLLKMVLFWLAFMIVSVFAAIMIARSICGPLIDAVRFAGRIASNDLDGRIESSQQNELGTLAQALNRMSGNLRSTIGELASKEEGLRQNNELLERVFSTTETLIAYLDNDFNYIRVNRGYANTDNHRQAFFIGKNHFDLFPNAGNEAIFRQVVETGRPHFAQAKPFAYPGGPEHGHSYWDWSLVPAKNAAGETDGLVLTLANVTERVEAAEALHQAHDELEARVQERTAELANANQELQKLSRAVQQSPTSIVITNTSGSIEYVNPMFSKITGYCSGEVIGKNPRILKSGRQSEDFYNNLWQTIKSGDSWHGEILNRKKNGDLFWENASISPIMNEQDEITGYVAVNEDITERKQAEEELRRHRDHLEELVAERTAELSIAKETAEIANQAKSAFLANMSHEIRTPLNGILGMTQLLREADLNEQQRDYIGIINHSGQALLTLINDILDLSKVEAGELKLEPISFNLERVADDVIKLLRVKAQEKGLVLDLQIMPNCPIQLVGDAGRIRQILLNLVGNAIKFTDEGRVLVRISGAFNQRGTGDIEIHVEDSGIGIEPEVQHTLFESFTQADVSTTRRFGGTGLGLSISKQLVDLMGGEISMESIPGEGSVFLVKLSLPLVGHKQAVSAVTGQPIDESNHPAADRGIHQQKLLLVEDELTNRTVALTLLNRLGFKVTLAIDGYEAVEKSAQASFDLILMDCQMPIMDGFDATKQIRSHEKQLGRHTPIIALTANACKVDRERCLEAGMDDFLAKPYTREELQSILQRWLPSGREATVDNHEVQQSPAIAAQDDTAPVIDRQQFNQLSEALDGDLSHVIPAFIASAGEMISELHEVLAADNDKEVLRLTHSIKSSSANLGASRLSHSAGHMERWAANGDLAKVADQLESLMTEFDKTKQALTDIVPSADTTVT